MRLLLDENLPQQLRLVLPGHEVFTAAYMGWAGVENGDLLRRAAAAGFDALVTTDRGLEYQQNLDTLPLSVVVVLTPGEHDRGDPIRPARIARHAVAAPSAGVRPGRRPVRRGARRH